MDRPSELLAGLRLNLYTGPVCDSMPACSVARWHASRVMRGQSESATAKICTSIGASTLAHWLP